MAAFNDREAGYLDVSAEDSHLIAGAFDYTEEVESPFMESPIQNLDADTDELDISHFVGDLRALMVDDSEDEIVLDSDDEAISKQKQGKIRGRLWRHAQAVDVRSSAGSNLTDKVTDNVNLVSNNENEKGDKFVNLNATSNNFEDEMLVVDESEEPGESSEADALDFVDHFLSVSGVKSSPEFKILKYDGRRSPFTSCAKGSQKLAMKTSFMTKIDASTFDWDIDQPDHGGELFLEKKTEVDIQRDDHLDERYKESDVFDVGFNTQMAAEAMESLLYSTPIKKPSKQFLIPLSSKCDSQMKGISFKQKRVANKKHQMSTSFLELPNIEKAGNCMNGNNLVEPKKKVNEKSLKVYRRKKQKEDLEKEKVYEKSLKVYKRKKQKDDSEKENVKPDKEVKTFSPVASRTRHGSSVKSSKRTLNATYNGNQIDVIHKRKLFDLKLDTWKWPKKKRTCRNTRQNTKLTNMSVVKSDNGDMEGYFREAFFMSNVKRKARSASINRSTSGKKKSSLVDISNRKCVSMNIKKIPETLNGFEPSFESIPFFGGKEKIKDIVSNGKNKTTSIFSKSSRISYQDLPQKQLHKTSFSLRNEVTRLGISETTPDLTSKDLRRRRSKVEIRVLFSQSLDDDVFKQQRKILENLGICMATDCSDATHFVADRFARTKKMLEAMAFGKQIVTPLWLESCEQAGCIIDEKNYILRDSKKEKEINFSMPVSLSLAKSHPLLKDRRVFITPNVKPEKEMIEKLVNVVHGEVMEGMEYKTLDDMLILSCEKDYVLCVPFLDKGASVYSSEILLNGIIIQKLEYAKHQLFKDHVIMKRYTRKRKKNGRQHLDVADGG